MHTDFDMILVDGDEVGIRGLRAGIEAAMVQVEGESDAVITAFLLEKLGHDNWIAGGAKEKYGRAFLREYKKARGVYLSSPDPNLPKSIKVYGAGDSRCERLTELVREVLAEEKISATLDPVTDLMQMARDGVLRVPALVIDGETKSVGVVPSRREIREWLNA